MNEYEIKEIKIKNGNDNIYGEAYIPKVDKKVPLVIFSHELSHTYKSGVEYAKILATHNIATYTFDYRGGSYFSKSDGKTTEMSLLTEIDDLKCVIEASKSWNFVDKDKIILMGASLGGTVSALTAAIKNDEIFALILLYPGFLMIKGIHEMFNTLDNVPDKLKFKDWIMVDKKFITDVWDIDLYKDISNYKRPVLIIHGDSDKIVPIHYSKDALKVYNNAKLKIINGADHIFRGDDLKKASFYILEFLKEIMSK